MILFLIDPANIKAARERLPHQGKPAPPLEGRTGQAISAGRLARHGATHEELEKDADGGS